MSCWSGACYDVPVQVPNVHITYVGRARYIEQLPYPARVLVEEPNDLRRD